MTEKNVWKVAHDDTFIELDCRIYFQEFTERLRANPGLAMVAHILFALRQPNTELDTQFTPVNGDYSNVIEALEKHRTWALDTAWIGELKPQ
jgi:hypothetical protein